MMLFLRDDISQIAEMLPVLLNEKLLSIVMSGLSTWTSTRHGVQAF